MAFIMTPIPAQERPQIEAPAEPPLLAAPAPAKRLAAPAPPLEHDDARFPRHMLRWTVIGVIAYFGVIAASMIYAALLSPAAIR